MTHITVEHLDHALEEGPRILNGLSVDVEDYYHVEAFADRITPEMWPRYPSRVADNVRRTLEILDRAGARATFFVMGDRKSVV